MYDVEISATFAVSHEFHKRETLQTCDRLYTLCSCQSATSLLFSPLSIFLSPSASLAGLNIAFLSFPTMFYVCLFQSTCTSTYASKYIEALVFHSFFIYFSLISFLCAVLQLTILIALPPCLQKCMHASVLFYSFKVQVSGKSLAVVCVLSSAACCSPFRAGKSAHIKKNSLCKFTLTGLLSLHRLVSETPEET